MEHSPYWEANSHSASQEIPHFLWNLKVHYHVYKTLPPVPIQDRLNPDHTFPPYFPKTYYNVILSSMLRSSMWSLHIFQPKFCMHFSSYHECYMPCPSHPPSPDHPNDSSWSIQVMKLLVMQSSPVSHYFCLLGPNILLSTQFSHTFNLRYSLSVGDQVSCPYKTRGKIIVFFFFFDRRQEDKRLKRMVLCIPQI
jgi:hypothetical protein